MKSLRILCTIMVFFAVLVLIIACGKNENTSQAAQGGSGTAANVNPPGEFPICKEPIDIQVGIIQNATVENYETNLLTKWYEEKGNFKLRFDFFPSSGSEARNKLEVMVASGGTLPEVLIGFTTFLSDETILSYGTEGAIIPLNAYYDKWAYYIPQVLERVNNKDLKQWLTSADGNIYFIPKNNEQIGNLYHLRSWINKVWLDKLGLEMPKTTDEFRAVLEAFAAKDPNGNGQRDEIGMIGGNLNDWGAQAADFIMNAFIYDDTSNRFIVNTAGKIEPVYTKDEWREGLRYMNSLFRADLLPRQSFTMDGSQMRQMVENGQVSQVGVFTHGSFGSVLSAMNTRKLEYVPLPPLTGPNRANYVAYYPDLPQKNFIITKDAKNPEAIFRWGDLMCSEEGYMRTRWGVPDVDWKTPGPEDKSLLDSIGVKASVIPILPWGSIQNSHWLFTTAGILPFGVADGQVAPASDPLYVERWTYAAVPFYMGKEAKNRVDIIKLTMEEAEEIKELKTTINNYVNESLALFVVGDKDVEKDWSAYCRELDVMGLARYLEISQSGYDRAIGKK
ncbi:MAG: extracellular solute-binding protein [Treponema sp.]|nr:extracellular solute-binding protein [Treponema sp.]